MAWEADKHLKALYFDLCVRRLKDYYSKTNPLGAYKKIRNYLLKRNFTHRQYSGYHSEYKTTDLEIFDQVLKMSGEMPWLPLCLNHFEVTDVGPDYDLMHLFEKPFSDPDTSS
ncbi:MAG: hypothetical protein LUE16_10595 [Lachnospiraceae bacterium]|nr:hypothetical protein [Lachnospiraceae bacterium]